MHMTLSTPAIDSPARGDEVLIVAARVAYREYLHYHAYVCQPGRSFRDVERLGFYHRGLIEAEFPSIRAIRDHVTFTPEIAAELEATGSAIDREIAGLVGRMLADGVRRNGDILKVFLLTPHDDDATLRLSQTVTHRSTGRGSAWTMGHRYVSEAALLREPATTDELNDGTNDDHDRPNVGGLYLPEYAGKGTPTLRSWLRYWEGVLRGTRRLTPGSNDTVEQAPSEIQKLTTEIAAREADGYAGADRHRGWSG